MDSSANLCHTTADEDIQKVTDVAQSSQVDTTVPKNVESSSSNCSKLPGKKSTNRLSDVQYKIWKKRRLMLQKKKLQLEIDVLKLLKKKEEIGLKIQQEKLKQELVNTRMKEVELRKEINNMMGRMIDDLYV